MTPARCYRRCSVCGLRWNVSRLVTGPERYGVPQGKQLAIGIKQSKPHRIRE